MSEGDNPNISVIIAGAADAGKSTFIGVLSKYANICNGTIKKNDDQNYLDDGNGKMRESICNFKHEIESGQTSSVATKTLLCKNNKIILVDLCGQPKYLKTTLYGITGFFPDYGVLIIGANRGLIGMTKEHLNILLTLNLTFAIIITRVDTIKNTKEYFDILNTLKTTLTRYRRKPLIINQYDKDNIQENYTEDDVISVTNEMHSQVSNNFIPIISISNKTGYYINYVKYLFDNFKPKDLSWSSDSEESIFYVDANYKVSGFSNVVSGILKGKVIKVGDILNIGPIGKQCIAVKVSSIHDNERNKINELYNRQRGCLAIKPVSAKMHLMRESLKKGIVLMSPNVLGPTKNICYILKCDVQIINTSTTSVNMCNGYCPVIHCNGIRQSAKLLLDEAQCIGGKNEPVISLKIGKQYTNVKLEFLYYPVFLEVDTRFFFREENTKGRGFIREIYPL